MVVQNLTVFGMYQIWREFLFLSLAIWLKTALASFQGHPTVDHLQYFKGKCVQWSLKWGYYFMKTAEHLVATVPTSQPAIVMALVHLSCAQSQSYLLTLCHSYKVPFVTSLCLLLLTSTALCDPEPTYTPCFSSCSERLSTLYMHAY